MAEVNQRPASQIARMLVAGHAICYVAVLFSVRHADVRWPHWLAALLIALMLAETGVLTIVCALAGGSWFVRIFGLIFGIAAICVGVGIVDPEKFPVLEGFMIMSLESAALLCILVPARLLRLRIERLATKPEARKRGELQFSMTHLLGCTLAVGLLLGVGRLVRVTSPMYSIREFFEIGLICACFAGGTVVSAWAALARASLASRALFFLVVTPVVGFAPTLALDNLSG
jgi:hypothetical protein